MRVRPSLLLVATSLVAFFAAQTAFGFTGAQEAGATQFRPASAVGLPAAAPATPQRPRGHLPAAPDGRPARARARQAQAPARPPAGRPARRAELQPAARCPRRRQARRPNRV